MSQDWESFKKWFAIGVAVLLIGLVLQWYPNSVIGGIRERLTQSDVTSTERLALQEDLNSRKIWQVTGFQPVSLFCFTAGIIILVYSILSALFSIASGYTVAKRTQ